MKKEIYSNPDKYKYNKHKSFEDFIFIESRKEILKSKCENLQPKDVSLGLFNSFVSNYLNDKEITSISLLDELIIDFKDDLILTINGFIFQLKPFCQVSESLSKFLKIPYLSFFKTNTNEINQELVSSFFKKENFKNTDAKFKMNLLYNKLTKEVLYIFDPKETFIDLDNTLKNNSVWNFKELLDNYEKEGFKFFNMIESSKRILHFYFIKNLEKLTLDNTLISNGVVIEFDTYLSKYTTKNVVFDLISNNYFISDTLNFTVSKLESLNENLYLGSLGKDSSEVIEKLFLIASFYKIKLDKILSLSLYQLLEDSFGNFNTITLFDLLRVLSTFSKIEKYNSYFKTSLQITMYINVVYRCIKENINLIDEKFFKKYAQ